MQFTYRSDLLAMFPDICGGLIYAKYVTNGLAPLTLQQAFQAEQEKVKANLETQLSEIPSLKAWRTVFRRFGANPTKYRSAAEALLRRLDKKGEIPSVDTLVDIGNLVSIRYALPVAVFDADRVTGSITVHPSDGSERFVDLTSKDIVRPDPGEVIFTDETNAVLARRWCWRQSAEFATRPRTSTIVVTVEAHHESGSTDVEQAVADLVQLITAYAGGRNCHGFVNAATATFTGLEE